MFGLVNGYIVLCNISKHAMNCYGIIALDTDGKDMENRSLVTLQELRFGQVKSEPI